MLINSVDELKNYDQIILLDGEIDSKIINKHIKDTFQKRLVLIINEKFPLNAKTPKIKGNNIYFKFFSWSIFNHRFHERWHPNRLSIKNSKFIYEKLLKTNKLLINFFIKLYSSKEIIFGFKKSIALKLNEYYQVIKIYELIKEYNTNVIVIMGRKKYNSIKKLIDSDIPEDIQSDFHQKVLFYNESLLNKIFFYHILIFAFYPFFSLLSIRKFVIKKIKKNVAIRIYRHGMGFNHFIDWIIDKDHFRKNDSLFVIEDLPNKIHINDLKKNKYNFNYCANKIPLKMCSFIFFLKIIFLYIPVGLFILPVICTSNQFLREEAIIAWVKFFSWKNFISIFKVKSYLSYHNYTTDHIYRNILLKKINCITAMYKTTHSENILDYKNKDKYADVIHMNYFYDIEFHGSKCSAELSRCNESKSKKLLISGPFAASREFLTKNNNVNISKDKFAIGLFTSNFNQYNSINSVEAHKKFLLFTLEICNNYPSIKIIFKPKNNFAFYKSHKTTRKLAEKLSNYNNFMVVGATCSSATVCKTSDVIISMAFTSPGFEAMCMGKKSFYVDLLNIYKNSYFDNFQKLVSHSHEDALSNLKFWMEVNQKDVLLKYKEVYRKMGIETANQASEIMRNRILATINNR